MKILARAPKERPAGGKARALLPAAALLLSSLLAVPALALRQPSAGQEVALLFPPGTPAESALRAVAAADGLAVRAGGFDNLLVARFPHDLGWPAIWRLGALAALDPAFAGACAADLETASTNQGGRP
ncbi:MAG: hypothetical protein WD341_05540 [Tistlia sp.]|uniref:hypothetical protein n=1 Tax=Tistlia sp. TaxID=3057121 RepID=UPI0034A4685E